MTDPPTDRIEFLIRFVCATIFFGIVIGLIGVRFIDSVQPKYVAIWGMLTIGLSLLAGFRGDEVWRRFAGLQMVVTAIFRNTPNTEQFNAADRHELHSHKPKSPHLPCGRLRRSATNTLPK